MIESAWTEFKVRFEMIQRLKADIACEELLRSEAQEKAKVWRLIDGVYLK